MSKKARSSKKTDPNRLTLEQGGEEAEHELIARAALRPTVQAASTLVKFNRETLGELDLDSLITALSDQTKAANNGDLGRGEAMLAAQAHTLDAIFNTLARRCYLNMGEYLDASDRYMRLALRAQSQCRATWETLMTIKNPPMAGYVRQANIAHGHQQVNNGQQPQDDTRARENQNPENELLEEKHGERLDFGAAEAAGGVDSDLAPVGEIDRTQDKRRKD